MFGLSGLLLRRLVLLCFIGIYLLLGLPLWYKLTSVYRSAIPIDYIRELSANKYKDIHVSIPLYVDIGNENHYPDFTSDLQKLVDKKVESGSKTVDWSVNVLKLTKQVEMEAANDSTLYHILKLVPGETLLLIENDNSTVSTINYNYNELKYQDLLTYVSNELFEIVFALEWKLFSNNMESQHDAVAISYNPNIHLTVSLLTGDGNLVSWEIDEAMKKYVSPLRSMLSSIYNITVDTSIVYFNDLNLPELNTLDTITQQDISYKIDLSEVLSSNNHAEDINLNLAIVFPSKTKAPEGLKFINSTSSIIDGVEVLSKWESFLVPQWGALIINKYPLLTNLSLTDTYLKPVIFKFSEDLLKLLNISYDKNPSISTFNMLDSFKRYTTIRNIYKSVETMESLVKLTQAFEQMSIPEDVLKNINHAIKLRKQIIKLLNNSRMQGNFIWDSALQLSNELVKVCESAFFDGEMVQQNFFPQEHKMAVYFPLLGPISMVILLGIISHIKESKASPSTYYISTESDDVKEHLTVDNSKMKTPIKLESRDENETNNEEPLV